MLNIIEPKDHGAYQGHIDSFLNLLAVYQNYSPSSEDWENGTFIIASDNEYGVYGGVLLLEKYIWDLEIKIRRLILTFNPDAFDLWTGQVGFYREPHGGPFSTAKVLQGYIDFYHDLLKALNDFGHKKEISFLCLSLNPIEHIKIKKHGFWNYVGEVSPNESLDGLFHGILPLSGRKK